jgi:hypothetical protein
MNLKALFTELKVRFTYRLCQSKRQMRKNSKVENQLVQKYNHLYLDQCLKNRKIHFWDYFLLEIMSLKKQFEIISCPFGFLVRGLGIVLPESR